MWLLRLSFNSSVNSNVKIYRQNLMKFAENEAKLTTML